MEIAGIYSHLGGIRFLLEEHAGELEQLCEDLYSVEVALSVPDDIPTNLEFSPAWRQVAKQIHSATERVFRRRGWEPHVHDVNKDRIWREHVTLGPDYWPGWQTPHLRFRETTRFYKRDIAMEVRFAHHSYVTYDLFSKFMNLYANEKICVGILVVPWRDFLGLFPPHITSAERVAQTCFLLGRRLDNRGRLDDIPEDIRILRCQPPYPLVVFGMVPDGSGRKIPEEELMSWLKRISENDGLASVGLNELRKRCQHS